MRKFQLVPILIVALLFPISGDASDKDVNVINTPMVEVVNTDPVPTVVGNTSDNPIPVTMNGNNCTQAIVSAYSSIPNATLQTVYTVPENKTLILTDFISSALSWIVFEIYENENLKTKIYLYEGGNSLSLHLRTGIPFTSGSNVKISHNHNSDEDITITGYLLNN